MDTTVLDFLNDLDSKGHDVCGALELADKAGLLGCRVVWNSRLRTTAGRAKVYRKNLPKSEIQLNPRLRIEGDAAIHSTFIHELAHVITGQGHNRTFRRVNALMGGDTGRCHNFESMKAARRSRAPRKLVGHCDECGIAIQRVRSLPRGTYFHSRCGGMIVPVVVD